MKTEKQKKARIDLRLSVQEKARIQILADQYAHGNISAWLVYGGINAPRRYLKKKPA